MDYLQGLNAPQREAVEHKEGPLIIIAGAGSGKTKVLTTRIAHLMNNGVDPFNILALTFTNKAAKEMKERVEKMLGGTEARNLFIGTFHSVFARILRREAPRMGYPSNFTIYDADDAKSLVKTIVKRHNLDPKTYKPKTVINRISAAKNALIHPKQYEQEFEFRQEDLRANCPLIYKLYASYAKECFKNGAMDFDDLLLNMYDLLTKFPEALVKYQHKFKYILIDEYQDTNPAQYAIIKLLGDVHENICVVGDDAQSIYSFRGATIQNILKFEEDYEDVKVVKLEQNYRSTKTIIEVANQVISCNKKQIKKQLWTDNAGGEKINLMQVNSDNEEGKYIGSIIAEQKVRNHFANKDFAILYRTNSQSRSFEESLRRRNIPYRIFGGLSFYQRKEIKDLLAYLRIVVNPQDEVALRRIINYPTRGIGKVTLEKATIVANKHGVSLWQVFEKAAKAGFRGSTLKAIEHFVLMIKSFQTMLEKHNAYDVAFRIGKETGMVKELFKDKSTEGIARYENIQELLNSIKSFTETPTEDGEITDKDLGSYLQQIALLTDADQEDEDSDVVSLMTIHAAKGLEFPNVFVVGIEEGLFPNIMAINEREDLEEERRLFYVAVTRAEKNLWLTFSNSRYRFGKLIQNEPSRFLKEIPKGSLNTTYKARNPQENFPGNGNRSGASSFGKKSSNRPSSKGSSNNNIGAKAGRPTIVNHKPSSNFQADNPDQIETGMEVEHAKFGFGKVLKTEGNPKNRMATIFFQKAGEKKIMLNYARLMIVKKQV